MNKRMFRLRFVLRVLFVFLLTLTFTKGNCQEAIIKGIVNDSLKKPIEACNVSIEGEANGTITDSRGRYTLKVTPYKELTVVYSFLGFAPQKYNLKLTPGETK